MTVEHHLRIAGALLLGLAALHVPIAWRLRWREELTKVSYLTRQIFWVHTGFIVLLLIMMGLLGLAFAPMLTAPSGLARIVLSGLAAFWAVRLYTQWFVYDRAHWRGDRFNTCVHFAMTGLWAYLAGVFAWAAWNQPA